MDKVIAAVAMLLLALIAGMGSVSPSLAQGSCKPIGFSYGKNIAVLSGLAPVDDVVCYGLDAEVGQNFTVKVLRGDNTVFGIQDICCGCRASSRISPLWRIHRLGHFEELGCVQNS